MAADLKIATFRVHDGALSAGERCVPDEVPVAIVHDAMTYAVMMATPGDLEDFAIGLSFTEGVIETPEDVRSLEIARSDVGIEVRLWLQPHRGLAVLQRRRTMAGPTGCGLCGVESLAQTQRLTTRPLREGPMLAAEDILTAMASLWPTQALGAARAPLTLRAYGRPAPV